MKRKMLKCRLEWGKLNNAQVDLVSLLSTQGFTAMGHPKSREVPTTEWGYVNFAQQVVPLDSYVAESMREHGCFIFMYKNCELGIERRKPITICSENTPMKSILVYFLLTPERARAWGSSHGRITLQNPIITVEGVQEMDDALF